MNYEIFLLENFNEINVVLLIFVSIISYLIGNISPSTIIAKRVGVDIRNEGSKNAGTTNTLRTVGLGAGILTLIIDFGKGLFTTLLCFIFFGLPFYYYSAFFVILGHMFPVVYKLKGGKGVATTFGVLILIMPVIALIALAIVIIMCLISKKMSLSVIISSLVILPLTYFFLNSDFLFLLIILSLIILKHLPNIGRLLIGKEPNISFGKPKKEEKEFYEKNREKSEDEYLSMYQSERRKTSLNRLNQEELNAHEYEDENEEKNL